MRTKVGDHVWYIIPAGPGQLRAIWARAVVVKVGPRLVGMLTALGPRPRYATRRRLSTSDPIPELVDVIDGYSPGPRERHWIDGTIDRVSSARV